jgi:hypothetical protein
LKRFPIWRVSTHARSLRALRFGPRADHLLNRRFGGAETGATLGDDCAAYACQGATGRTDPSIRNVHPHNELFKYFTKLVTKATGNPAARGSVRVTQAEKLDVIFSAMRGLRVFQPMGFTLPKQNDEELPIGEDGHTRAPAHTRDRMGDFPSVAFWNWDQQLTDWFNVDTGEALAEYEPSAAMRELVAGIEFQRGDTTENTVPSRFTTQTSRANAFSHLSWPIFTSKLLTTQISRANAF